MNASRSLVAFSKRRMRHARPFEEAAQMREPKAVHVRRACAPRHRSHDLFRFARSFDEGPSPVRQPLVDFMITLQACGLSWKSTLVLLQVSRKNADVR